MGNIDKDTSDNLVRNDLSGELDKELLADFMVMATSTAAPLAATLVKRSTKGSSSEDGYNPPSPTVPTEASVTTEQPPTTLGGIWNWVDVHRRNQLANMPLQRVASDQQMFPQITAADIDDDDFGPIHLGTVSKPTRPMYQFPTSSTSATKKLTTWQSTTSSGDQVVTWSSTSSIISGASTATPPNHETHEHEHEHEDHSNHNHEHPGDEYEHVHDHDLGRSFPNNLHEY